MCRPQERTLPGETAVGGVHSGETIAPTWVPSGELMLAYIIRRVLLAIPTLFGISVLSFVIMHLPPGDFLTTYASILSQQGEGKAARWLVASAHASRRPNRGACAGYRFCL